MRSVRHLIKNVLGPAAARLHRTFMTLVISAERKAVVKTFRKCGADLEIVYPWDIRGNEFIQIGSDVFIGPEVLMIADRGAAINIGSKVMLGPRVRVIASDHRYDDTSRPIKDSGYGALADVIIGSDVWIGTGVTLLKGVNVANGAIVGAGAVVTCNIGPNEIWAGNPARKVKDRFGGITATGN
jgi:acetyltransferase-like isoleucine patch superfamily enzyme